jgi:hypothetical protein
MPPGREIRVDTTAGHADFLGHRSDTAGLGICWMLGTVWAPSLRKAKASRRLPYQRHI